MAAPPTAGRSRRWELDALRGLMLVLMLSTHLPTFFALPLGQPFGFVSAAEGFVMLSAYMAGLVYTQRSMKEGIPAMRKAFLRRAMVVYLCQAASLLFLFTVIAWLGMTFDQAAARNLISFYLAHPSTGLWASLLLIYNPPLLDILPIYVMFMLLSPWVLAYGLQHGWRAIAALSGALWVATQFGLSKVLYDWLVAMTGLSVPFRETGSFETFAWQALWIFGLWMGARHAQTPAEARGEFPRWLVNASIVVAVVFFIWRHLTGQEPFPMGHPINFVFDKWHLGPMRLVDFFALMILVIHFESWLKTHMPRLKWLETMGAASLPVFCAHLVLVLLALALLGETNPDRPMWIDPVMFVACIILLYGVARVVLAFESRAARKKAGSEPADASASAGRVGERGGDPAAALRTSVPPAASPPANPDAPR